MNLRRLSGVVTLAPLLTLTACGSPTIDASSDKHLEDSVAAVREALPEEERETFDQALAAVVGEELSLQSVVAENAMPGSTGLAVRIRDRIHEKTAEEILAAAAEVGERKARELRAEELAEREALRLKAWNAEQARWELEAFEVIESTFALREGPGVIDKQVVTLRVRNGTDQAVSRAYFEATLMTPGRQVPWLKESTNYAIQGGLEPGEDVTWTLTPPSTGQWHRLDAAPPGAVFAVTSVRLDGADGAPFLEIEDLTDRERGRLRELEANYSPSTPEEIAAEEERQASMEALRRRAAESRTLRRQRTAAQLTAEQEELEARQARLEEVRARQEAQRRAEEEARLAAEREAKRRREEAILRRRSDRAEELRRWYASHQPALAALQPAVAVVVEAAQTGEPMRLKGTCGDLERAVSVADRPGLRSPPDMFLPRTTDALMRHLHSLLDFCEHGNVGGALAAARDVAASTNNLAVMLERAGVAP
jgi:hypothetical protein